MSGTMDPTKLPREKAKTEWRKCPRCEGSGISPVDTAFSCFQCLGHGGYRVAAEAIPGAEAPIEKNPVLSSPVRVSGEGRATRDQILAGMRELDLWSDDTLRETIDGYQMAQLVINAALSVAGSVGPEKAREGLIARLHDLTSHRNPHWSDEENRAYCLGVNNAIHRIENPDEEHQATAGQPVPSARNEGEGER